MKGPERLTLGGRDIPLVVRRRKDARRLTLTADAVRGEVRLTLPAHASGRTAERFLASRLDWLAERAATFPAPMPFRPGAVFPLEGEAVTLDWQPGAPRKAQLEGSLLVAGGPPEFLPRRIQSWLRARALHCLSEDVREIAEAGGLAGRVSAIAVRDTKRQWGSCAADGRLSFCWRLICAPPFVRRAIVAHELAHLTHRNHGAAFHREAERLSGGTQKAAHAWLGAHGASLHWIGRE